MNLSIEEILHAVDGTLLCGNLKSEVRSICINSKDVKEGALFVPIKGQKIDAHDFIDDAFKSGAVACLTERDIPDQKKKEILIKVKDSVKALQDIAKFYRSKFNIPVIGVTGSVGKTTTKEMIACAMSDKLKIMKTEGNFNGQIGVPLTLFNLDNMFDVAVIEMGMSEFGEMERISRIARPNIAVINNIGVSHIENLHTRENILKEKLHIADFIGSNGKLFFNGDNDIISKANLSGCNRVSFGLGERCDCRASDIEVNDNETKFKFKYKDINFDFKIPVIGTHNIYNALVAILVSLEFGADIDDISRCLLKYKNIGMRQDIHRLDDMIVIDDSYNASPDSMRSAIDVLKTVSNGGRSIAVLADMLELGYKAEHEHFEIGKYLSTNGISELVTIGTLAKHIADGFNNISSTKSFDSNDEAIEYLLNHVTKGCSILVKGSRGMHTDQIVRKLLEVR